MLILSSALSQVLSLSRPAPKLAYISNVSSEPLKAFPHFSSACGDHINIRSHLAGQKSPPQKASITEFLMLVFQVCVQVVMDSVYNI